MQPGARVVHDACCHEVSHLRHTTPGGSEASEDVGELHAELPQPARRGGCPVGMRKGKGVFMGFLYAESGGLVVKRHCKKIDTHPFDMFLYRCILSI